MSLQPFKIHLADGVLAGLRERLTQTRWVKPMSGSGWDYGTDPVYLRELVSYWHGRFDWRAQEAALNRFSHFRANLDGFHVHFLHERGKGPNPFPLVLTHGFPDSFVRMLKVLPLLTDPGAHGANPEDSFDVVIPSLPGYGFSDKPERPGMTGGVAEFWWRLLRDELNYRRFGAHGGDMGSGVSQQLALAHPEAVASLHLTDVPWQNFTAFSASGKVAGLSPPEQKYFAAAQQWMMSEGAYAMIQSTKPQTLALGLNDSPAGLAAWIVEKFRAWSDCQGDVATRFTKDELLTNITIYWATETIDSAFLYYYEPAHQPPAPFAAKRVETPTAFANFPRDLTPAPREWAERFFSVARWTDMPRGGHFAALEEPELLVDDIRTFFRPLRGRA